MAHARDNTEKKLSVDEALALFADAATSPEMRRDALSALMEQKALAKKQSESMVLAGRALLLQAAVSEKGHVRASQVWRRCRSHCLQRRALPHLRNLND
jgi:hypothetical protein